MNIINNKRIFYISTLFAFVVGVANVSHSWTAPTVVAPGGDTNSALNVGTSIQEKAGSLGIGGLGVFGTSTFLGDFSIIDGTQGEGKILISDKLGNASWVTPPVYDGSAACPDNTVPLADGECGYTYTLVSAGYFYCSPGDERVSWYDSGIGRNHTAGPLDPNGCYAFEGRHNNGGPGCTMQCRGKVKMCLKMVNGQPEWSLSGPDRICK